MTYSKTHVLGWVSGGNPRRHGENMQIFLFSPGMESSTIRTICAKQRNHCIDSIHTLQFTVSCGLSNYTIKLHFYKHQNVWCKNEEREHFSQLGSKQPGADLFCTFCSQVFPTCRKRLRCRMRMSGRVHRLIFTMPCWSCLQWGHFHASSGASWRQWNSHFSAYSESIKHLIACFLLWLKCVCKRWLVTAAGAITKIYTLVAEVKQSTHKVSSKSH